MDRVPAWTLVATVAAMAVTASGQVRRVSKEWVMGSTASPESAATWGL
jgi:hypothetical protein